MTINTNYKCKKYQPKVKVKRSQDERAVAVAGKGNCSLDM